MLYVILYIQCFCYYVIWDDLYFVFKVKYYIICKKVQLNRYLYVKILIL